MADQVIRQYRMKRIPVTVHQNATVLPLSWPARLAAWLLSKTKHQVVADFTDNKLEYVEIRADDIRSMLEAIFDTQSWMRVWHGEVDRVIVGREMYEKLLHRMADECPFEGMVDVHVSFGREIRLRGINVQFIPWIEGWAVIPKETGSFSGSRKGEGL